MKLKMFKVSNFLWVKSILLKIHDFITIKMSESRIVDNFLIARFTEDDGIQYDCIYCTILRNAILFACIGFIIGFFVGWLL